MKELAVIILNWNGAVLLRDYLPDLVAHTSDERVRLLVVDNGSTDDSCAVVREGFPTVELIAFDQNYGFAEGYNRALDLVEEPYVCLLNSDVRVVRGWYNAPLRHLKSNNKIAALQPKIRSLRSPEHFEYAGAAGGFVDCFGYPFCRGRIFGSLEKDHGQYDDARDDLHWASGACLFVRRELYLAVGGLDARFFAHQEEIDLCWRLRACGYSIGIVPEAVVYHLGGASLDMQHPYKTYLNFRNNLLMIYKNYSSGGFHRLMAIRFLLDMLSAVVFFLTGKPKHSRAVLRARRDYKRMRSRFNPDRFAAQEHSRERPLSLRPYCIVWQYYVLGRKIFSAMERSTQS